MDGVIEKNPLEKVSNVVRDREKESDPFPFTRSEIERFAKTYNRNQSEKNAAIFATWTGLSASEVLAISWGDVDIERGIIEVRRATVDRAFKVPKERGRVRNVELLEPAKQLLRDQKLITYTHPPVDVEVVQRDNIKTVTESVRLVFKCSKHDGILHYDAYRKNFKRHLIKAGIDDRGPNQCRHTYASQLLSNHVDKHYIAQQMGHADVTMINRHYGQWIQEDSSSRADEISRKLGFKTLEKV